MLGIGRNKKKDNVTFRCERCEEIIDVQHECKELPKANIAIYYQCNKCKKMVRAAYLVGPDGVIASVQTEACRLSCPLCMNIEDYKMESRFDLDVYDPIARRKWRVELEVGRINIYIKK